MSTEPVMAPDGEAMPERIDLRLKWRQTWAEKEEDFVAQADGYRGNIGRIYRGNYHIERWHWSFQASGDGIDREAQHNGGVTATARQAAMCVEEIWFRFFPDRPSAPSRNAYAEATDPS